MFCRLGVSTLLLKKQAIDRMRNNCEALDKSVVSHYFKAEMHDTPDLRLDEITR